MNTIARTVSIAAFVAVFQLASAEPRPVAIETSDGLSLSAVVAIPQVRPERRPAVIFLHQGGSSKEEWTALPLFDEVTKAGMVALALDIRGHGGSEGEADFSSLFNDPNQAPRDLEAALRWLADSSAVDMERVAVVGASIGANLAVVAVGSERFNVKTAVAISAKTSAVYNLAGGAGNIGNLQSIFMIASELEEDGKRAFWAEELHNKAESPRQIEIASGSDAHGVSIFTDAPALQDRILSWLSSTL